MRFRIATIPQGSKIVWRCKKNTTPPLTDLKPTFHLWTNKYRNVVKCFTLKQTCQGTIMSISDCKDVANHGVPLQLCNRFKKSEQPSHEDVVDFLQQSSKTSENSIKQITLGVWSLGARRHGVNKIQLCCSERDRPESKPVLHFLCFPISTQWKLQRQIALDDEYQ